jgi:cyclic lactone autoinducer peptide
MGSKLIGSDLRPRLTYANVMSTIALFIALAGSASASGFITGEDIAPTLLMQQPHLARAGNPREKDLDSHMRSGTGRNRRLLRSPHPA